MQDDERHYGGSKAEREQIWAAVRQRKANAELPVETELVDGVRYMDRNGCVAYWYNNQWSTANGQFQPVNRLGPVARYEPPKPETPEPKGLGAVVRTARGNTYVRSDSSSAKRVWARVGYGYCRWLDLEQPIEVLSEGVEL